MNNHRLRDKVAIVTGASSGIGRETALALARQGARVALAARSTAALEEVAGQIQALGGEVLVAPTDVAQREQVQRLVTDTLARWGRVDILVASAGQYVRCPAADLTLAAVGHSLAVNFYGALHTFQAVLPHLLKQGGGHLVYVSSMDARKGLPLDAPYVAAKAAMSGYVEVLRQELHGTGVRVTTVFPGRVDTPMIASIEVPWISAKIPPQAVARATVRAILRGRPQVIVPLQAHALDVLSTFFPRLGDWAVRLLHLEGREIDETGA